MSAVHVAAWGWPQFVILTFILGQAAIGIHRDARRFNPIVNIVGEACGVFAFFVPLMVGGFWS